MPPACGQLSTSNHHAKDGVPRVGPIALEPASVDGRRPNDEAVAVQRLFQLKCHAAGTAHVLWV